jgi:hypothetical protein
VVSAQVLDRSTDTWLNLDINKTYTIAVNEYNRWGGDGMYMMPSCGQLNIPLINTIDAIILYTQKFTPINQSVDGRILVVSDPPKHYCEPLAPILPVGRTFTDGESIVFMVLTIISILAVLGAGGFAIRFQLHPVMVASSVPFLFIILVGFLLVLAAGFLEFTEATLGLCNARVWLMCIGFILSYGAMLAKNWRVYQIFSVKNLRRVKPIPTSNLIYRSSFLLVITLAILVLWSALAPLQPSTLEESQALGQVDIVTRTYRVTCYAKQAWPYAAIFAFFGLLMVAGFVLSFLVRKAPVEFHESKWIAFITYAIVLFGAVMILLFYLASTNELVWFALRTALFILLVDICLCLLFIPKIMEVLKDPTKQRLDRYSANNNSMNQNSLPSMTMKSMSEDPTTATNATTKAESTSVSQ